MEKIYMEENKQKQNQKQSKGMFDISVLLSFGVSIFAIISLLAVGISNVQGNGFVSYAVPTTALTGDSFTISQPDYSGVTGRYVGYTEDREFFSVPALFSDTHHTSPVFCVERKNNVIDGKLYSKSSEGGNLSDFGLLYLLNSTYAGGKNFIFLDDNNLFEASELTQIWATQVAIYLYESETNNNVAPHTLTSEQIETIKNIVTIENQSGVTEIGNNDTMTATTNTLYKQIRAVVDTAKEMKQVTKRLSITKADGDVSKTSDGKYFQSTLITVIGNPSDELFIGYDITLSGIDGAFIVDENGKQLETKGLQKGQKFYVRIPADKIGEKKQTLKISALGHFSNIVGSEYVTSDTDTDGSPLQKVVSVTGTTEDVSEGISIDFIGAPDTSMNTAQTIYFIGLIVLLCGIGIVYANTKTAENKQ